MLLIIIKTHRPNLQINIIMQPKAKTNCYLFPYPQPTQDTSPVQYRSNSFRCCLQPKRASLDVKLFLQLHNKIMRRTVIEHKFQENLYVFQHGKVRNRKGFVGNALHDHFHRRNYTTQRDKWQQQTGEFNVSHFGNINHRLMTEPSNKHDKTNCNAQSPQVTRNASAYRKRSIRRDNLAERRHHTATQSPFLTRKSLLEIKPTLGLP